MTKHKAKETLKHLLAENISVRQVVISNVLHGVTTRPTSSVFIVSVAELTHWVFKLCIALCLFFFILLSVWVHIHHSLPVGSLCAVGLGQMLIYSWPELSVCQRRLTQQWYSSFTPSLLLLFGLHCVRLTWALVFVNTPAHVIDVRLSDFPILADQCVYL